ncbi:MAG TPA: hydroxyisourate hydrolase [Lapillicoccus sp.]|jgi:5-hydroxyisourate hydrolase|nr:hydroxyisourate hydrolase [Lapillicoccus sp.]
MSYITAHVLDAAAGVPAAGVTVRLATADGTAVAEAVTDDDGRVGDLGPDRLDPGVYRVTFGSGDYFAARRVDSFHPEVSVLFTVAADQAHYHIPLLLSPYSYTTYRGS